MDNIVKEYIEFIKKTMIDFYKIILDNQYNASLVKPLIDHYIMVRYYNETNYPQEKDFVDRISKELSDVIKTLLTDKNEEELKNINYLFGYLFYFDDCYVVEDSNSFIECLRNDQNLKIEITEDKIKKLEKIVSSANANKINFHNIFDSKQFFVEEKLIKKNLYLLKLEQNIRISNLYSDYAIKKAFNTGIIREDKLFIILSMACNKILNNAVALDFSRYYFVDFVPSLFAKEKKLERLFKGIDNTLVKKHLVFTINYEDYIQNKEKVNILINEGFSFSIIIDYTFDENYRDLILFTHIFLPAAEECYNLIMENKGQITSELIII